jgi:hypothetical protein
MRRADAWSMEDHAAVLEAVKSQLWRFVQQHASVEAAGKVAAKLAGLHKSDIAVLTGIHLLLDPRTDTFLDTAEGILQRLRRSGRTERTESRTAIRGRIEWPATVRAQAGKGGDPLLYVSVRTLPSYDLPENRVVKYLLHQIVEQGEAILGATIDLHDRWAPLSREERRKWRTLVEERTRRAARALRSVYLKGVTLPPDLSEREIRHTAKVRSRWYQTLAEYARFFREAVTNPRSFLREVLNERVLAPLSRDTLYELWTLFTSAEKIQESGWKLVRFSLIGGGREFKATFEKNGDTLRLYYQKLPPPMAQASRYCSLMSKYGLGDSHRRPDLVLAVTPMGKEPSYLIVEVKRTRSRTYTADGVYKLIGYLADFQDTLPESQATRGILVVWSGLAYRSQFEGDSIVMAGHATYPDALRDALKQWA